MNLKLLSIVNFRNYEKVQVEFTPGIHVIVGKNGQGKTNLLESIYYLSCTKSHRIKDDRSLIKNNSTFFNISACIEKQGKEIEIRCNLNESGKNLFLYRNPIKKVSDFIGFFNAVMFYPDDMNLFSSTPKRRRQFVDLELGKLSKTYTKTLNDYYQILKERNSYLKNDTIDEIFIDTLDDQLIALQLKIVKQRKKFMDDILSKSEDFYLKLSGTHGKITYDYISDVNYDENEEVMKSQLYEKYKKNRKKDLYFKSTSIGIHRDDYMFYMNGEEVNTFASQGQKRVILLSLKLGIVYAIHEITGEYPILLLDDVFSELDEERRKKLLELLPKEIQIFISTTDMIQIENSNNIHYWKIDNGMIEIMRRNSQ
ncbi:DNA replication/repair protein RecF [Breznakia pachnodae]|uniref:DNA replication and repair protein RecF n=1 Tax=Breznakia pachnodae TaxID=265178 RepID=A0ABU0E1P6_9FIRM|nr:DNA replication/repair protein RecF [Breznakia pachnodae]MDQ0360804.1 DNA replication and repair protein RecF [Breznakia pachnodae]